MPQPERYTVPAAQAIEVVELVKRWDVGSEALLLELGLSEEDLIAPGARLSIEAHGRIVERARMLSGEPGIGYYLGLLRRPSFYGYLGFAVISSATLRDALDLVIRFAPMVTNALSLHLRVTGDVATLTLEEHVDFGTSRDVILISMLAGLARIASTMTGREVPGSGEFAMPEPPYHRRFAHLVQPCRFAQPVTRLVFAASSLNLPLVTADRVALRLTREECERALTAVSADGRLAGQVRELIANGEGGDAWSIKNVATSLGVSPRTLKRKLAAQGVSFSSLVERQQRERALLLLRSTSLSLEEIGLKIGYSSVQNFTRAFRRWMKTTPAAYRRAQSEVIDALRE